MRTFASRGVDAALVVALVFDHLLLDNGICFHNQRGCVVGGHVVQLVGDRSQPVQAADERNVVVTHFTSDRRRDCAPGADMGRV